MYEFTIKITKKEIYYFKNYLNNEHGFSIKGPIDAIEAAFNYHEIVTESIVVKDLDDPEDDPIQRADIDEKNTD